MHQKIIDIGLCFLKLFENVMGPGFLNHGVVPVECNVCIR